MALALIGDRGYIKPNNTIKCIIDGTVFHIDLTDVKEKIRGYLMVASYRYDSSRSKTQNLYRKRYLAYNPKTKSIISGSAYMSLDTVFWYYIDYNELNKTDKNYVDGIIKSVKLKHK